MLHFTPKRGLIFWLLFMAFSSLNAQYNTWISDTFNDTTKYDDLLLKMQFGTFSGPVPGFQKVVKADGSGTSFTAITQTDSAKKYAGYINPNSTKASLAFDYRFPTINRNSDSIMVEFDVLWDQLVSGGNQGRIVVALMHELPVYVPFGTITDSLSAKAPFGRPAYSFRILNRIPQGTNNYANMMYGGGKDSLGEFEKYANGANQWWLPGFISGPGGISPESSVPNYPIGPVERWRSNTVASATAWQHFTWKIFPENLEVWARPSIAPSTSNILIMKMFIPKLGPLANMLSRVQTAYGLAAAPDSLPSLYHWFPEVNGLRFFMNGQNQTYFANVQLKTSFAPSEIRGLVSDQGEIQIFPNPVDKLLKIKPNEQVLEVQCFDSKGRKYSLPQAADPGKGWEVSHFNPGLYWMLVKTKNGYFRQKFLKE
jgi:hypothetical protein